MANAFALCRAATRLRICLRPGRHRSSDGQSAPTYPCRLVAPVATHEPYDQGDSSFNRYLPPKRSDHHLSPRNDTACVMASRTRTPQLTRSGRSQRPSGGPDPCWPLWEVSLNLTAKALDFPPSEIHNQPAKQNAAPKHLVRGFENEAVRSQASAIGSEQMRTILLGSCVLLFGPA